MWPGSLYPRRSLLSLNSDICVQNTHSATVTAAMIIRKSGCGDRDFKGPTMTINTKEPLNISRPLRVTNGADGPFFTLHVCIKLNLKTKKNCIGTEGNHLVWGAHHPFLRIRRMHNIWFAAILQCNPWIWTRISIKFNSEDERHHFVNMIY